jgi:hypothetical protein
MIKKLLNCILILTVCLSCLCLKAGAQNIQAIAKLAQTTIRIGDQTKLHLSVEQPVNEKITFPVLTDTITSKILVVSSSKPDTLRDKSTPDRITVTKSFMVTSFDEGSYVIPPFVFTKGKDTIKTNESVLTVQSVKVDTTKAIYDIKQPLAVSYSFMDWLRDNWLVVLLTLLTVLIIGGTIYYLKKRQKNKPVLQPVKPEIPIHTLALSKLGELRDKKMWQQGEVKQYYSELSDIIREYLGKRYKVQTYEKTTDEIFASLEYLEIKPENKVLLHQLLTIADLVKFAKEKPLSAENEQHLENAISFVLKTQQTETSENTEGGSVSEHI